jgi:hypothetical protein
MEYREDVKTKKWHFSRDCSHWPPNSFNIVKSKKLPRGFEACKECIALREADRDAHSSPYL